MTLAAGDVQSRHEELSTATEVDPMALVLTVTVIVGQVLSGLGETAIAMLMIRQFLPNLGEVVFM